MPPPSKVITMLPAYVRQEVERRIFENGFRDYDGLAQWVRGEGYEISDDSLWRYGRALQEQLATAALIVRHARALAKLGGDHEGLTAQTLITVAQQKALAALLEMEEVKAADLNAIANLTRAAIAQQRWAAEQKERDQQQHTPAAAPVGPSDRLQPPDGRPTIAPLEPAQTTGAAPSIGAERQDDSPAAHEPGDNSEQPMRESSTPPGGGLLAAPANAPASAILPTGFRSSPRIDEILIPSANANFRDDLPTLSVDLPLFDAEKGKPALTRQSEAEPS